jgi:hypothetical protein
MISENLVLRPKPFKTVLLALTSLLFTVGGILVFEAEKWKGALITSFFGLCFLTFVIQLIPGSIKLTLTKDAFIVTSFFRSTSTRWSDVKEFKIGYIGKSKFLKFDFSDKHSQSSIGKGLAKFLSGNHGALPSNYGMTIAELCNLMNEWKESRQSTYFTN